MAKQTVNVGTSASDGTGDDLRVAFTKINENFDELYSGNVNVVAANVLVYSVAGRTGNVVLTVNDIAGGVSKAYVDSSISANIANVTGATFNSINANVLAANLVISNHSSRINSLESNSAAQALQINSLVSVKANISYVDTSIDLALSNSAIAANLSVINSNVTAANLAIANLQSNAATQGALLETLVSNAASQATTLNTLTANAGAQAASIISLTANAASQSTDIVALQGNTGTLASAINTLTANAAAQALLFNVVNANVTAANLAISNLTSNAASQALDIDNLFSNAGLQAASINSLISNAASQATTLSGLSADVSTLVANAGTQAASIQSITSNLATLTTNAASQGDSIEAIFANLSLQTTNAASQAASITSLTSNAAVQAQAINSLNANLTAANSNIVTNNVALSLLNANVNSSNVELHNATSNVNILFDLISLGNAGFDSVFSNISTIYSLIDLGNTTIVGVIGNVTTLFDLISIGNTAFATQSNLIDAKANLVNPIFSSNLTAGNILVTSNLYVDDSIKVGSAVTPIDFPDLGGRFVGNTTSYYQIVLQNLNAANTASADFVVTRDNGDDSTGYVALGINSSNYDQTFEDTGLSEFPGDGYVEAVGANLAVRSTDTVFLAANTSVVILQKDGDLVLFNTNLIFSDFSVQTTAWTSSLDANLGSATNNISSLQTNSSVLFGNVSSIESDISTLFGNVSTIEGNISTLNLDQPYTMGNYLNWTSNVSSVGEALDQLALRLKNAGF
jgi:uncharacterized coiled-coil protein SlyX